MELFTTEYSKQKIYTKHTKISHHNFVCTWTHKCPQIIINTGLLLLTIKKKNQHVA